MSRLPPYLKQDDIIDVIAPGFAVRPDRLTQMADLLGRSGWLARFAEDLCEEDAHPVCAHDDAVRADHLMRDLADEGSKAVWAARGGYGCGILIPKLMQIQKPKQPKWVVGFSDITALHLFVNQHWGWPSLHAPVLGQMISNMVDEVSIKAVCDVLAGRLKRLETQMRPLNDAAQKVDEIQAPVRGGNLTLIQTSIGTNWQMQSDGCIIFIEEVGEDAYRLHRSLMHVRQSGVLVGARAIIFGDFTETDDEIKLDRVLADFAQGIDLPVLKCTGIGHDKRNMPLVLGYQSMLTGDALIQEIGG